MSLYTIMHKLARIFVKNGYLAGNVRVCLRVEASILPSELWILFYRIDNKRPSYMFYLSCWCKSILDFRIEVITVSHYNTHFASENYKKLKCLSN